MVRYDLDEKASRKCRIMKERVFEFLTTVPKGKVVTYGQIAEYLGNKKSARAVGNILHNNPNEDKYPCYKVVDSQGKLSKHFAFGGIEKQKEKLEKDGIAVVDYKVDLDKYKMPIN
jgi:methylated-DNA-protein-cysteine methyltransferase-like protein